MDFCTMDLKNSHELQNPPFPRSNGKRTEELARDIVELEKELL